MGALIAAASSAASSPWTGFDLDGTLAEYHGWQGVEHIGPPIEPVCALLRQKVEAGEHVRIFTARVSEPDPVQLAAALLAIHEWCQGVFGFVIPVTNVKDYGMRVLYDDRSIQVEHNTGRLVGS